MARGYWVPHSRGLMSVAALGKLTISSRLPKSSILSTDTATLLALAFKDNSRVIKNFIHFKFDAI